MPTLFLRLGNRRQDRPTRPFAQEWEESFVEVLS